MLNLGQTQDEYSGMWKPPIGEGGAREKLALKAQPKLFL